MYCQRGEPLHYRQAGTCKTTFLRKIKDRFQRKKVVAVLALTGGLQSVIRQ